MTPGLPSELSFLLDGAPAPKSDQAWSGFLDRYSRLIIFTARSVTHDRDEAMDAYVFVAEALQRDDYRTLRAYSADGTASFTTWLTVVARRLSIEYRRKRLGRSRGDGAPSEKLEMRWRLAYLVGSEIDMVTIPSGQSPEHDLLRGELVDRLNVALDRLPVADRLLIVRRFEDELSVREIANLTGSRSVYHVYRRLNSILKTVREDLESGGVEGPHG